MEDIDLRQVKIGYFPDSLILLLINISKLLLSMITPLSTCKSFSASSLPHLIPPPLLPTSTLLPSVLPSPLPHFVFQLWQTAITSQHCKRWQWTPHSDHKVAHTITLMPPIDLRSLRYSQNFSLTFMSSIMQFHIWKNEGAVGPVIFCRDTKYLHHQNVGAVGPMYYFVGTFHYTPILHHQHLSNYNS